MIRYTLSKVGTFWEVFDWTLKTTAFATEDYAAAVRAKQNLVNGYIPNQSGGKA